MRPLTQVRIQTCATKHRLGHTSEAGRAELVARHRDCMLPPFWLLLLDSLQPHYGLFNASTHTHSTLIPRTAFITLSDPPPLRLPFADPLSCAFTSMFPSSSSSLLPVPVPWARHPSGLRFTSTEMDRKQLEIMAWFMCRDLPCTDARSNIGQNQYSASPSVCLTGGGLTVETKMELDCPVTRYVSPLEHVPCILGPCSCHVYTF